MGLLFELLGGIFTKRDATIKRIKEEKPIFQGFLLLILTGVLQALLASFTATPPSNIPRELLKTYEIISSLFKSKAFYFILVLSPIFTTFILAAIYDLFAQIIYKKTAGIQIFIGLSFVSFIYFTGRILSSLLQYTVIGYLSFFFSLIFFIYGVYIATKLFKECYEVSSSSSLLLYFLPFILLFVLIVILLLTGVIDLIKIFGSLPIP